MDSDVSWFVSELTRFRGTVWLRGWVTLAAGESIRVLLPDDTTIPTEPCEPVGGAQAPSGASGFRATFATTVSGDGLRLAISRPDGSMRILDRLAGPMAANDPYHQLQARFFAELARSPHGRVLELGARGRSGTLRRELAPPGWQHVGVDLLPGDGVDVVADAHDLSRAVARRSFDAAFAVSVFEHLLLPWRVVDELRRVLRPGAPLLVVTHQTFPLHDQPADYWRFSDNAWHGLFNPWTGFAVEAVALGEQAHVVPVVEHAVVRDTAEGGAFLGSAVIARKTSRRRGRLRVREVVPWTYPA